MQKGGRDFKISKVAFAEEVILKLLNPQEL